MVIFVFFFAATVIKLRPPRNSKIFSDEREVFWCSFFFLEHTLEPPKQTGLGLGCRICTLGPLAGLNQISSQKKVRKW